MKWIIGVGVVLVIALSGCAAPAATLGPATFGGAKGSLCVPSAGEKPVIVGEVLATNGDAIRVTGVSLESPDHLDILQAYVLPIVNRSTVGSDSYPPVNVSNWADRAKAKGARISAGAVQNLVVVLKPGSKIATAKAIRLLYTTTSGSHYSVSEMSYTVRARCN